MVETMALFRGASSRSSKKSIDLATRICNSLFISENNLAKYATSAIFRVEEEEEEEEERGNKAEKRKKWRTLPPFTPTANAASVAKQLSKSHLFENRIAETSSSNVTALKWVLRSCPGLPRSLVQKLFRLRQVRRESFDPTIASNLETKSQENRLRRVSAKDGMNLGDIIFLPVTVQEFPSEKQECPCNEDEIKYIRSLEMFKDSAIIVVNKPPGMPVQGGIGISKSLDLLAATYLKSDYLEPPRLVHRLDRDSSGILVMGRTQESATLLHSIFREKTFGASNNENDNTKRILQRKYWALVIGTPRRAKGSISAPLGKVVLDNGKSERITTVSDTKTIPSQHAVTEYRVIESSPHGYTWIELRPLTGRKHQLRVHCAEVLGTPIVGDYKYGWQAHRNLIPMPSLSKPERNEKLPSLKTHPFGLNLESGSISEKRPWLHLHCRKMVLPNVSLILQHMQASSNSDFSKFKGLEFIAPLPWHMQRSWDMLNCQKNPL